MVQHAPLLQPHLFFLDYWGLEASFLSWGFSNGLQSQGYYMGYNVTIIWKTCRGRGLGFCRNQTQSGPKIYRIHCLIYPSGSVIWIWLSYAKQTESAGNATKPWWETVFLLTSRTSRSFVVTWKDSRFSLAPIVICECCLWAWASKSEEC